jgi:hypothetical protein
MAAAKVEGLPLALGHALSVDMGSIWVATIDAKELGCFGTRCLDAMGICLKP